MLADLINEPVNVSPVNNAEPISEKCPRMTFITLVHSFVFGI